MNTLSKRIIKCVVSLLSISTASLAFPFRALADSGIQSDFTTVDPGNLSGGKVLAGILNVICYIAGFVGIIFVAIGVFQIVMGFRNDDGESKSRGGLQAGSGIALLSLGIILKAIFF